jgi:hypothetical protein
MKSNYPEVVQAIANQRALTNEIETSLEQALATFNQSAGYEIPKEAEA